jgi:surfactin family lipopeptide synthetase A
VTDVAGAAAALTLSDLVSAVARRDRHRVAVELGDEALSYGELDRASDAMAAGLSRSGLGHGANVGLCQARTLEACISLLAVLKAGATVVPLEPDDPIDRLGRLAAGCDLAAVVADATTRARVAGLGLPVIQHDDIGAEASRNAGPDRASDGWSPAYILHTSGSTGRPKPVVVPHSAATRQFSAIAGVYGLGEGDRVLQFASFTFDVAFEELFATWAAGATVVMRDTDFSTLLAGFGDRVGAARLTVVNLPASFWHEWVLDLASSRASFPPCLRLVVVGSEPVSAARVRQWLALPEPRPLLVNAYGTTETTVTNLVHPCRSLADITESNVPVGRPIAPDVEIRILGDGGVGELCIGGPMVASGYYGLPHETAARFFESNDGRPSGAVRMYRTGDIARRLPGGVIELVGRVDEEIQLRGHRIAPAEVEAALLALPDVHAAWVGAVDVGSGPKLAAVVAAAPHKIKERHEDVEAALRDELTKLVPPYMVPAAVVAVDRLPRTSGGVIATEALRAHARERLRRRDEAPPTANPPAETSVEGRVTAAWADVLRVDTVDPDLNFFDHGGDSLLLVRLHRRLSRDLAPYLEVNDLFEHPTVHAIAKFIASHTAGT